MARDLTDAEEVLLRSDGQFSLLYLSVLVPSTVLERRLNVATPQTDKAFELTYDDPDGGTGVFGDVTVGETLYVSALGYGQYEKGLCRVRKAPDATKIYIGETSEINFVDNDYLTVVHEHALWPKHLRIDSAGETFMDYDVDYVSQHAVCAPAIIMGPPGVVWLQSGTKTIAFDASDTWSPSGSPSTYAWTAIRCATGAAAGSWDNATSATPTLTLATADLGTVRIGCAVTMDDAAVATGYRYIFVYNDEGDSPTLPTTYFTMDSCSGDWNTGGWSFKVTMYDEALRSEIRDRTLIVLHAQDWYGGTAGSIGPLASNRRANVIAVGWVDGESIRHNPELGVVNFTVQGPHWWIAQMSGFPSGVDDYDGTPTTWTEFNDLTVDKGLWHFLYWCTTATTVTDCQLTGDTRQIAVFDAPPGSLWQQLTAASEQTILAHPCCDRYGRLFVEINSQFLPVGDRGSIPTVQDIETQDWYDRLTIERRTVSSTGLLDLSGVYYINDVGVPYFSLSPGHVQKRYGGIESIERLALTSQAQANTLAGLILANRNNEYPSVGIPLAANHRAFDICPHQYATMSIAVGDTERGIIWSTFKLIPRRVSFRHDVQTGIFLTDLECEGYTTPALYTDGDPPVSPPSPPSPPPPGYPPLPPLPPTILETPLIGYARQGSSAIYRTEDFDIDEPSEPTWVDVTDTLTNIVRIGVDQLNRYIYVLTTIALYRASVDTSSPSWTKIFGDDDLPTCVRKYMDTMSITKDGYVGIPAVSTAACTTCDYTGVIWDKESRPMMIIVSPDGTVTAIHLEGGIAGQCCPTHVDHDAWAWGTTSHFITNVWHMCGIAADITLRWMTECNGSILDPVAYDCNHTVSASGGDATAGLSNEDDFGGEGSESLYMNVDMGIYGFGTASLDKTHLRKFTYDADAAWTDVTPDDWPAVWHASEHADGFDRDAVTSQAVIVDGVQAVTGGDTHLFVSTGGQFETLLDWADLSGPGRFAHCSCYYDDSRQLFLACTADGGDAGILWTTDRGATWKERRGGLDVGTDIDEIRVVWTEA